MRGRVTDSPANGLVERRNQTMKHLVKGMSSDLLGLSAMVLLIVGATVLRYACYFAHTV